MTSDDRNLLRDLIDQARRHQLQLEQNRQHIWQGCSTCGTHYDNHTPGCRNCQQRHKKRRLRRTPPSGQHQHGTCKGCGCSYHDHTPGCAACHERHRWRDRVRREAA